MLTRSSDYLFTSPSGRSDVIAPRGENQGFFPGSRQDGAAVVANQETAEDLRTPQSQGLSSCQRKSL